ncbi:MAG TPA: hypothetical protein VK992_01140 [Candidatus Caenarcaniphilales bacterium]|nr:hypothetical protein [Candidatus Caenarcaniphilales bacterium]
MIDRRESSRGRRRDLALATSATQALDRLDERGPLLGSSARLRGVQPGASYELTQLGQLGLARPEPDPEARLHVLDVGQRLGGEHFAAAVGQIARRAERVEQLARPLEQDGKAVELGEA